MSAKHLVSAFSMQPTGGTRFSAFSSTSLPTVPILASCLSAYTLLSSSLTDIATFAQTVALNSS